MKVGIIGLGYWGPNLVRNFLAHKDIEKVYGCDKKEDRRNIIKSRYPRVELLSDFDDLLKKDIDAVIIATPVDLHYKFAKKALEHGKHIWVEKPFTSNSQQGIELIELAEQKNLRIFVDHTFIYTGAVNKMKDLIKSNELGDVKYFDSVRINLGLFQHDINVIWDLAPHDLSIMNYLLDHEKVVAVSANGVANYYNHENIAHLSLYFENDCFAHFHVNWTSPVKLRNMVLGGSKKMLVFNDMENFEKIKVYDSGVEINSIESIHEMLVQYRTGDMYSPKVNNTEALALGADEFIKSIKEGRQPLTNGNDGLEVVKILEASDKSIKNRGQVVEINNS